MKWCSVIGALFLALSGAWAQSPDDQYIQIYNLIQEADKLNNNLQPSDALPKYLEAQTALQHFQKSYLAWNPQVITFRLSYVTTKIAALSARVPAPAAPVPGNAATNAAPPPSASPAPVTKPVPSDWEALLAALTDQGCQLQADKAMLEAKLKETVSVQPAALEPLELARAEEKIRNLQKENDLLKVGLEQANSKPVPAPDKKALDEPRQALAEAMRARQPKPLEPGPPAAVAQLSTINYQRLLLAAALGGIVALAASVWILAGRRQVALTADPSLAHRGRRRTIVVHSYYGNAIGHGSRLSQIFSPASAAADHLRRGARDDADASRSLAAEGPDCRATGGARQRGDPQGPDAPLEPVAQAEAGAKANC